MPENFSPEPGGGTRILYDGPMAGDPESGQAMFVPGFLVGHATARSGVSGATVVLCPPGSVGGVDIRGGAPGTREIALLGPLYTVSHVDAIVLTGGSAFGLAAVDGVMQALAAQGRGLAVGRRRVPIVPAAVLFDLDPDGQQDWPDADTGRRALAQATAGPIAEGAVGAGTGASVGKLLGAGRACQSGVGVAVRRQGSLVVGALAAVNALGEVRDEAGHVLAGVRADRAPDFLSAPELALAPDQPGASPGSATTLVVVATNARLDKAALGRVAIMAHDGLARSIFPVHTPWDGDTVFAVASGALDAPALAVGTLAADLAADAIRRAVKAARGRAGRPAGPEWLAGAGARP